MFTDIKGFNPLVEKLGPEEAYSIMNQVYETLIHNVHDYEDTVNEMTGDGIIQMPSNKITNMTGSKLFFSIPLSFPFRSGFSMAAQLQKYGKFSF